MICCLITLISYLIKIYQILNNSIKFNQNFSDDMTQEKIIYSSSLSKSMKEHICSLFFFQFMLIGWICEWKYGECC